MPRLYIIMEVQIQVSKKQIIDFEHRFETCSLEEIVECPCCFRQVIEDDRARRTMISNLSLQENYAGLFKDYLVQLYEKDKTRCPVCEKQIDVGNIEKKCEIEVSLGIMVLKKIHSDSSTKKSNNQYKPPIILENYIVADELILSAVNIIKKMSQLAKTTRSFKTTHHSKTTFRVSLEIFGNALSEAVDADLAAKPTEMQLSTINAIGRFAKIFLCILEKTSQLIDTVGLLAITDNKKLSTKITKYSILIEHYCKLAGTEASFSKGAHFLSILLDCIETIINIEKSVETEEIYIDLLKSFGIACIFISENISKIVGICTDGVLRILLTKSNCAVGGKNLKCFEIFKKIIESVKKLVEKSSKKKRSTGNRFLHNAEKLIRGYKSRIDECKQKQTNIYNKIANHLHTVLPLESSEISEFDVLSQEIDFLEIALIILEKSNATIQSGGFGSAFGMGLGSNPDIEMGLGSNPDLQSLQDFKRTTEQIIDLINSSIENINRNIDETERTLVDIDNQTIENLNEKLTQLNEDSSNLERLSAELYSLTEEITHVIEILGQSIDQSNELFLESVNLLNNTIPRQNNLIEEILESVAVKVERLEQEIDSKSRILEVLSPSTSIVPPSTVPLAPSQSTLFPPLAPLETTPTVPLAPLETTPTVPLAPLETTTTVPLAPLETTPTVPLAPLETTPTVPLAPLASTSSVQPALLESTLGVQPPAVSSASQSTPVVSLAPLESTSAVNPTPPLSTSTTTIVPPQSTTTVPPATSQTGPVEIPAIVGTGKETEGSIVSPDTYETRSSNQCFKNNNRKNRPDLVTDYNRNIEIIRVKQNNILGMLKRKNLIDNNISPDDFFREYIENQKNNFTVPALCSILEYISSPEQSNEGSTPGVTEGLPPGVTEDSPSTRTRLQSGKKK